VPLVSLDHIAVAFGHLPLLDDVSFQIEAGERVCIIGRNGTGKSTLLRILSGELAPDAGSVWLQPGVRRARLEQDVPLSADRPVFDVVSEGLGELSELVAAYHHTAVLVSTVGGASVTVTVCDCAPIVRVTDTVCVWSTNKAIFCCT